MTLLVEDGSQVTGAVVYADEAALTAYALARGITINGDPAQLLIGTTNYIETLNYTGTQLNPPRKTEWPRTGARINGRLIPDTEIPQILIDLQCEVALFHDANGDPLINLERLAISESVGSISQTFSEKSTLRTDYSPIIKIMAGKLIGISAGGINVMVSRG